jgi:dihydrofolate synthase/folylpolyglutamate synthase
LNNAEQGYSRELRVNTDRYHINITGNTLILNDIYNENETYYFDLIDEFRLSYFETICFIAFKYFESVKPDYTVLETGLGGKYDATNVINNKTAVITKIAQDHIDYLGRNIFDIIDEKLGILKSNNELFVGSNQDFIVKYIKKNIKNAKFLNREYINKFNYKYPYVENIALANMLVKHLTNFEYFGQFDLPYCRFEKVGNFILDGAHNSNGILSLSKNFDKKIDVICSFTNEKDVKKLITILNKISDKIYLTEIPDNKRSIVTENIDIEGVIKIKNPFEAIDKAIENNSNNVILITGSLYLCAYVRDYVKRL